jgi:LysR family transcriptional regulator (chromosome initiation inhibitor)
MLDYASLNAVANVVREGSFERAAARLGITPSAVSQRVRALEERLGAILIVRGAPCTATALGRTLCAHVDRVRLLEQEIIPSLGQAAAPPTLPIAVNADSLATWFPAAVAGFAGMAAVALELMLDDEAHTIGRLRSGEVLAAVTASADPVPGCRTSKLGALTYVACASPAFVARHFATGVTGPAVAAAPCLRFDPRDFLQDRWARAAHGVLPEGVVHRVPSTHGFVDLGLEGLGWSLHPLMLVAAHLAAGRLVELAPELRIDVDLYWTVTRLQSAALQACSDAVRAGARRLLTPRPVG